MPIFNFSTRRVGGIRFWKLGRFCFSFCVTREYRTLAKINPQPHLTLVNSTPMYTGRPRAAEQGD
jgi:hypothetical protein